MAATTYRFAGDAAELFPSLTSALVVSEAEDGQIPGELRPGQTFTAPAGLAHPRIETADGRPTVGAPAPPGPADAGVERPVPPAAPPATPAPPAPPAKAKDA